MISNIIPVPAKELAKKMQGISFPEQGGLLPAIVQDVNTLEVLMLAYVNRESLQKTIETRTTWFWSRSRNALWNKGVTSGNIQEIYDIRYDCDEDTFLFLVKPKGPACHTGENSCFYRSFFDGWPRKTDQDADVQTPIAAQMMTGSKAKTQALDFLLQLEEFIGDRQKQMPVGAYTTYLFDKGIDKILKKIAEETGEVIIAAKNNNSEELICEAADLIYHLIVLLRNQNVSIEQIVVELEKRHKA